MYLADIQEYSNRIINGILDVTLDGFIADEQKQAATLHRLIIIVEAARQLSNFYPLYVKYNEELFQQIERIKQAVDVDYDKIDLKAVWEVTKIAPKLQEMIISYPPEDKHQMIRAKLQIERAIELAKNYGITRLILFGSALHHIESAKDLDLAYDAIDDWEVLGFAVKLENEFHIPVDIVPLTPSSPFTEKIERTGKKLL